MSERIARQSPRCGASALNSAVKCRRGLRVCCFFIEHSSRIIARFGVSTKAGENHTELEQSMPVNSFANRSAMAEVK